MKPGALIVMLLLNAQAVAQQPGGVPLGLSSGTVRLASLEDVDRALQQLRSLPSMVAELAGKLPGGLPSERDGRRMEDDFAEYLLTESSLKAITAMRARVAADAGTSASAATLEPVAALIEDETCRAITITKYWEHRRRRAMHAALVDGVIGYMNARDRADARARLEALNARGDGMRAALAGGMATCTGGLASLVPRIREEEKVADALLDDYTQLRASLLSVDGTGQRAGAAIGPLARSAACPAPPPPRAGTAKPQLRSVPDVADYYDSDARADLVTGVTRLRLHYDRTGCVVDALVAESSGSPALDKAALRFGLQVSLLPAVLDGEPISDYVLLPVRFSLLNAP